MRLSRTENLEDSSLVRRLLLGRGVFNLEVSPAQPPVGSGVFLETNIFMAEFSPRVVVALDLGVVRLFGCGTPVGCKSELLLGVDAFVGLPVRGCHTGPNDSEMDI